VWVVGWKSAHLYSFDRLFDQFAAVVAIGHEHRTVAGNQFELVACIGACMPKVLMLPAAANARTEPPTVHAGRKHFVASSPAISPASICR
jgi:hypothetical protein